MLTPHDADLDYLDYLAEERSARELAERMATAVQCEACDATLDGERFPVDGYVVCRTCAAHFVGAFLPEILEAAATTAVAS
jgi:ribosomal protein L37AE/L43A